MAGTACTVKRRCRCVFHDLGKPVLAVQVQGAYCDGRKQEAVKEDAEA